MKKIILLLSVFCVFLQLAGCGPSKAELEARIKNGEVWNSATGEFEKSNSKNIYEASASENTDIEVRVIDSCEYIIWGKPCNSTGNIIHKANCRNPIHKTNQ